ncbi:MAG: hypothetical protein JRN09_05200 [Nitrososphaerota archaeon]|nr:hypothetical protein [Nitrososphaerota archaeon]
MSGKRNISRTLTLLLFFVVIVIAVLVIFAYFSGLLGLVAPAQKHVDISGVFSLQNGGGPTGTLAFTVTNLSSTPITGASFSCPASQFLDPACGGLTLTMNGLPVSPQNTVPDQATASGASTVSAAAGRTFTASNPYSVTVTVTFSDGTSTSYTELLIAQA